MLVLDKVFYFLVGLQVGVGITAFFLIRDMIKMNRKKKREEDQEK